MNNINFQQSIGFPLETNTFDEMQKAYGIFNAMGEVVGDKVIVQGCKESGQNVADGVIYLNGEFFDFKGGVKQSTIVIQEDITKVEFEDGEKKDTYFKRYAKFGSGIDSYLWTDFKRVDDLVKVKDDIKKVNLKINSTNTNLQQVKVEVATNKGKIDSTNATLQQVKTESQTNKNKITSLQNDLGLAKNRITALERDVLELENQTINKEVKWVGRNVTNSELPNKWFIANGQNRTDNILGKMIVGLDTSQSEFNRVLKKGGAKTHRLTISEMPSHRHGQNIVNDSVTTSTVNRLDHLANNSDNNDEAFKDHGYTDYVGGSQPHNNLPPYIVMVPIQYIK